MTGLKYAIVGCGAIGGFYGAKLVQAGCDVHFCFILIMKQHYQMA